MGDCSFLVLREVVSWPFGSLYIHLKGLLLLRKVQKKEKRSDDVRSFTSSMKTLCNSVSFTA